MIKKIFFFKKKIKDRTKDVFFLKKCIKFYFKPSYTIPIKKY